ncbi:MAG: histidinol dehydrogenase [Actinobacteria bacterium]|nr:histidinol dehydrogenase [Actinomycetota bacterium]
MKINELNLLKVSIVKDIFEARELYKSYFDISENITEYVKNIVNDVKQNGLSAAIKYTNSFDKVSFKTLTDAKLSLDEINEGYESIKLKNPELVKAIEKSYKNIKLFHEEQLAHEPETWFIEPEKGKKLGQISLALDRICVYIPGGRYVYPSSVLMTVIPAQVAGVKEIVVCTPPLKSGRLNNLLLYLFKFLKISEVYKIGGAQAIALMAYGDSKVKKVAKIVGPGNIYVTAAKKIVYGNVGIDSLAGPSEIAIIADKSSNPYYIAADLLSQAEHDPDAKSILLTDNIDIANETIFKIYEELEFIKTEYGSRFNSDSVIESLKNNCKIIYNKDINLIIEISNEIAPEHLEIMTENPEETLKKISNAGSIFLGSYTPVAVGDYIGGTNHVIPTNGTAIFSSPLGVYDFFKKSAVTYYSFNALDDERKFIEDLADTENLLAHKNSVKIRFKS